MPSLPEAFAVPDCLHMSDVKELAAHFEDNRIPVSVKNAWWYLKYI